MELPSTQKVKTERTQDELRLLIRTEIEQGDNLPSFTSAGQKALSLIKQENIGIPELSKTILHDPGMTAAILRVVNSTFYGLQRNITKVPEAISYIGLSETKHIIYVAFARSLFGAGLSGKSWRHSVATAFIAEGIAKFSKLDPKRRISAVCCMILARHFYKAALPRATTRSWRPWKMSKNPKSLIRKNASLDMITPPSVRCCCAAGILPSASLRRLPCTIPPISPTSLSRR